MVIVSKMAIFDREGQPCEVRSSLQGEKIVMFRVDISITSSKISPKYP